MNSRAVVTPHHLSAEAARQVMAAGGNAVDGAVAAVAAQGVVAPETCGVGGDLFALVSAPGWSSPRALNSSGRAGSRVSAEAIRADGHQIIPVDHPAVSTIPGCVDGMVTLMGELGRLSMSDVLRPAIALAGEGFAVSTEQAAAFARRAAIYADNPAVADFYPDGRPVENGATVTRHDLARTLADVVDGGRAAFYEGTPGADVVEAVGGLITSEDLRSSQAEWVEPIGVEVAGLTAWTTPPNTQGYLGPASLAVWEMLDPPQDHEDPMWWHLLIEAYRCLAWERNDLVADPGYLALPASMLMDRSRLERAAATVDRQRSGAWPAGMGTVSGTAYMCAVDDEGMAVSIIQSNYNGTGSPFGAARSGFLLHDRGAGFNLMPGHPNELAPGKRPLHTLSPTLWTDSTGPRWTLGTRGGAVQPQLVAQVGARAIVNALDLDDAQTAPRWTVADFGPGAKSQPVLEPQTPGPVVKWLEQRGHRIEIAESAQPGW
ncbi:MAG TPA: gamma-glutamyltransferase, partial [Acidimicrobiia bacterium]